MAESLTPRCGLSVSRGEFRQRYSAARKTGGPLAPSPSMLQRAVARDVLAGNRAGLASWEHARRAHDVFLQRPGTHRNAGLGDRSH